jgi:hypothetical protein
MVPAPTPEALVSQMKPGPEISGQRADSPDLLFYWYDQAVLEEGEDGCLACEGETSEVDGCSSAHNLGGLAHDEKRLGPVYHPDETLDKEDEAPAGQIYSLADFTAAPPKKRARASDSAHSSYHDEKRPHPSIYGKSPHAAHGATPAVDHAGHADEKALAAMRKQAKAGRHDQARREALREAEALAREKTLRRAFEALYARLENAPQPGLEQRMTALLEKNYDFGWKQNFLFSDFGLALRRKRNYALALLSHRLALKLAPDDENIMFNVARAEYEMGDTGNARLYLVKALSKAPDFAPARTFLQFLEGSA